TSVTYPSPGTLIGGTSCKGECVYHPTTRLRGDRDFTAMWERGYWSDAVVACHDRGGRLPKMDEAWGMMVTNTWGTETVPLMERGRNGNTNGEFVLTGDVVDWYDPVGPGNGEKRMLRQVKVAAIGAPLLNGSLLSPQYNAIVYVQDTGREVSTEDR